MSEVGGLARRYRRGRLLSYAILLGHTYLSIDSFRHDTPSGIYGGVSGGGSRAKIPQRVSDLSYAIR